MEIKHLINIFRQASDNININKYYLYWTMVTTILQASFTGLINDLFLTPATGNAGRTVHSQ